MVHSLPFGLVFPLLLLFLPLGLSFCSKVIFLPNYEMFLCFLTHVYDPQPVVTILSFQYTFIERR